MFTKNSSVPPRFTGIRRKTSFSPNHVETDLAIIRLTSEEIEKQGFSVCLIEESELGKVEIDTPVIFNMCQGAEAVHELQKIEARGVLVINSPESILNCYRYNMARLLPKAGVPFPTSFLVSTSEPDIPDKVNEFPGTWIKRGDVHAVSKEDVVLAYTREEILAVLHRLHERGIDRALLQEHIEGDVIKFYAVHNNDFFEWYYHNKYGLYAVNPAELHRLAELTAKTMGLDVYGGDAIATPDGELVIIDINDWPSFAPFRERASKHIAERIIQKAMKNGKFTD
jgi:glutathione synthase/RimK-type ligase-like ATP-grasp enzyme